MNTTVGRLMDLGKKWLKFILPIAILLFLYWQTHSFIKDIQPSVALHLMGRLSIGDHFLLLTITMAAITAMVGYDWLLVRWHNAKLPLYSILRIGWIAGTFNNIMGFGGFTGAGLRMLMYRRREVGGQNLLKSVVYLSLSILTGLSFLGLLLLCGVFPDQGLLSKHLWLLLIVVFLSAYAILFLLLGRLPRLKRMVGLEDASIGHWTSGVSLITVSLVEWLAAAAVFYTVAHALHIPIGFREMTGIYIMAAMAGVASFVPGGLGSFDVIAILGLQTTGVSPDLAFAVVLLFRIFYYFIPWAIGLAMATSEWIPNRDSWNNVSETVLRPAIKRWHTIWNWPGQSAILRDTGGFALAALVFLSGVVLLVSAATPSDWLRMRVLEHYVTLLTMKGSHQLTVLLGLAMIILSSGIRLQIKRAYYATMLMLLGGAVLSILKGLDYEETIFLGIVFLLLWISKSRFRREDAVYSLKGIFGWAAVSLIVSLLYLSLGQWANEAPHRFIPAKLYAKYGVHDKQFLREAVIGVVLSWLYLTGKWLLRPRLPLPVMLDSRQLSKLEQFLQTHEGNYLTHLLFLGDKNLIWTKDNNAVLSFGQIGRTVVALGDPIGNADAIRHAVSDFRDYADRFAGTPVLYQVKGENLPLYHEFGYRFFKLGEEAVVLLDQFQLSGKRRSDLRSLMNRFEREGYVFSIITPPFKPLLLVELREVSDSWLGGRKEKGFSLGTFREHYLERAPVALLRDSEGQLAAFASMMPVYDGGKSISIDLMRYRKGMRGGFMDVLFVHLLLWAKNEGYERFNLGMAPLSSVGESVYSHRQERFARWIFLKGSHFYHFQGLRNFKEKYNPIWEPRYLAYPRKAWLPLLMMRITRLISRGEPHAQMRNNPPQAEQETLD